MRVCEHLHTWANSLPIFRYPFSLGSIPANGIYILFEHGETGHGTNRIVRIGTHRGNGQLPARLYQHFIWENKDRSIFRKNVGRALLNRDNDPFLPFWHLDLTTRRMRAAHAQIDTQRQLDIEHAVSTYMRESFSFVVNPRRSPERASPAGVEIDIDRFGLRDLSALPPLARP